MRRVLNEVKGAQDLGNVVCWCDESLFEVHFVVFVKIIDEDEGASSPRVGTVHLRSRMPPDYPFQPPRLISAMKWNSGGDERVGERDVPRETNDGDDDWILFKLPLFSSRKSVVTC